MLDISRDWLASYGRFVKEFGDVVYLRLAHVPIVLVVHPREIERVLVTDSANFTKSADYRALATVLGQGLLTSEGEFWRGQRGLIQPAFRRENILTYAPVMTRATEQMLASWPDGAERNKAHEHREGGAGADFTDRRVFPFGPLDLAAHSSPGGTWQFMMTI